MENCFANVELIKCMLNIRDELFSLSSNRRNNDDCDSLVL